MRILLLLTVLLLAACEGSFVRPGDVGRTARIEKTYGARDACLARSAGADGVSSTDAAMLAHAAAMACASETEKLVEALNPDGDAKVAMAIRKDSEFRAMKYVLKARGQAIF
jgi:tRNA C32,U32 (ribose-2'-O)-methylase TrmJ